MKKWLAALCLFLSEKSLVSSASLPPCEDFKLAATSGTEPETVLLGEIHASLYDFNPLSIKCINTLISALPINEPHLILLEGVEHQKEIACESKKIPNILGRRCIGWDDTKPSTEIANDPKYQTAYTYREIMELHAELGDKDLDIISLNIFDQIKTAYSKNPSKPLSVEQSSELDAYKELIASRESGKSYQQIFSSKKYKTMLKHFENIKNSVLPKQVVERNLIMKKTIESYPGIFKIVIAGRNHFLKDDDLIDSLEKNKHENPYQIYVMGATL